jgi:tRNA threonylcarbamoyladenosine biosynthesis protein TsaB
VVSILAFDSGGSGCTAAVLRDGAVAARRLEPMERGHAEALMPMIERVLAEAETEVAALDLIAVTTGPGAFTGLRIGLAAARGLALASGVPALGITRFAAAAAAVPRERQAGKRLVVALDSKRRELYLQVFARGEAEGDGALVPPERVADWLPPGALLLAGDAASSLARLIVAREGVEQAPGPGLVDAVDVARLAAAAWRPGLSPPPPRPLYLRAPDTTLPRPIGRAL